ncbi:hypothetical protein Tco_1542581, partial [Tanacetum coccineum]
MSPGNVARDLSAESIAEPTTAEKVEHGEPAPPHNDQDPEVSTTSDLFALANGPLWTPISVNSCVVDGV